MAFFNTTYTGSGLETLGNAWNYSDEPTGNTWSLSPLNLTTLGFLVDEADIYSICDTPTTLTYTECEC